MESLFVKLQALIAAAVIKRTPLLAFSCEYVRGNMFCHFYFFASEKPKAAAGDVL